MSKKYVITGCNGQLGRALQQIYPEAIALDRNSLDISDATQVEGFDWSPFTTIINAAAYVNADNSETEQGRLKAWSVNARGVANLAKVAMNHQLCLVHYSSEYVFDGITKNHKEDEPFSPLNVYGQTKAAGDLVASLVPEHYILRTSWVVGDGHNFPKTMKRLADMRIHPEVVDDQYGRLTFASELARATKHLLACKAEPGTYNVSNSGEIKSWADIAANVFEYAGYDRDRVVRVTTEEYSHEKKPFAPRPTNSDMDLSKLQSTGFVSQDYEPLMKKYTARL